MLVLLAGLYVTMHLGGWFLAGLIVVAFMLGYEHWLLRGGDLRRLDAAFFTMNGYISVAIFLFTLADVLLGRSA
jgi:4-hydroxybenzoate polyprenyltransferase